MEHEIELDYQNADFFLDDQEIERRRNRWEYIFKKYEGLHKAYSLIGLETDEYDSENIAELDESYESYNMFTDEDNDEKISEDVGQTDKYISETDEEISETEEDISETEEDISETNEYISETDKDISETNEYISETDEGISETNEYISETNEYISETEENIEVAEEDIEETDEYTEEPESGFQDYMKIDIEESNFSSASSDCQTSSDLTVTKYIIEGVLQSEIRKLKLDYIEARLLRLDCSEKILEQFHEELRRLEGRLGAERVLTYLRCSTPERFAQVNGRELVAYFCAASADRKYFEKFAERWTELKKQHTTDVLLKYLTDMIGESLGRDEPEESGTREDSEGETGFKVAKYVIEEAFRSEIRSYKINYEEAKLLRLDCTGEIRKRFHDELKWLQMIVGKKLLKTYLSQCCKLERFEEVNGQKLLKYFIATNGDQKYFKKFVEEWTSLKKRHTTDVLLQYLKNIVHNIRVEVEERIEE